MGDNIFDLGDDLEDDDDIEEEFEDGLNLLNIDKKIEKNTTHPVMTKYEKSVIIAQRIRHLDANYKTTIPEIVKEESITKSFDIAMREFALGKLPPFIIKRDFPDGSYEEWTFEDFKYFPPI
jgi:DNA-directed RNA polymerase subunit K/omega